MRPLLFSSTYRLETHCPQFFGFIWFAKAAKKYISVSLSRLRPTIVLAFFS